MWRIQKSILAAGYKYGITSTCVENTILQLRALLSTRDHLHMCGEYLILGSAMPFSIGSPPHVWRILMKPCINALNAGITSTYVENTDYAYRSDREVEDHLHIRGEYK